MFLSRYTIRWSVVAVVVIVVASLFLITTRRLSLDFDLTASLPLSDPVLSDAHYIFRNHPVQDRIVIDVAHAGDDLDRLVDGGGLIEKRLRESGLFKHVGLEDPYAMVPELLEHIVDHLPILFTAKELHEKVLPLLSSQHIRDTIHAHFLQLSSLDSIGQSGLTARDPLGLRNIVLSRLAHLVPSRKMDIYRGQIVSPDKKHLLMIVEPAFPAADTAYGRKVTGLIEGIRDELAGVYGRRDAFTLTPVGGYRAALDNELSAKRDMRYAVLFSTLAIAALLLLGFPRPLIGLLALLPAFAGTIMALFVYSLFKTSISMLAVGFGGAIISFTVDYGIAYLLFLDRPYATQGMEATKEVWSLGVLAMLTTAVSFSFLFLGGFAALSQLGWFAALGVLFAFLFVHLVYPFIFPSMPPAKRDGFIPLQRVANTISTSGHPWKIWVALSFAVIMLFFARPEISIDLGAMNSIRPETVAAERLVQDVWGGIMNRIFLLAEGKDIADLQRKSDGLARRLEQEEAGRALSASFAPSLIFPGKERAGQNFGDWKAFWSHERVAALKVDMSRSARESGFAPDAFEPFFRMLDRPTYQDVVVPEHFFGLLGISPKHDGQGVSFFATLIPGPGYRPEPFRARVTSLPGIKIFDPSFFGARLGAFIFSGFLKVALIIGIVTLIVVFLYLLDWQLTLVAAAPTVFALVCTLGSLNLMGEPLGIPVIMVSVVIIGMGTDYALYLVRSYQRYMDECHPSLGLIRLSVFMSFATTFLGFGVLAGSDHVLLRSVGLGLALGIGYSYLGAVTIVPPLLKRIFRPPEVRPTADVRPDSRRHRVLVMARYRHMEAYTRLYAWFEMRFDPLFARLAGLVKTPRTILDIGCGHGLSSAWLLELYPSARVHAVDPDKRRVLSASRVIGRQGVAVTGKMPDWRDLPGPADVVLLDGIQGLTDDELRLALEKLHDCLVPGGVLVVRVRRLSKWGGSRRHTVAASMYRLLGMPDGLRSSDEIITMVSAAGFEVTADGTGTAGRNTGFLAGCRI